MVWNNTVKEEIGYLLAAVSLIFGFALTIAGFCVPPVGEVHGSVLSVLGECFLFAAAVLGISLHVKSATRDMAEKLNREIDKRLSEINEKNSVRQTSKENTM